MNNSLVFITNLPANNLEVYKKALKTLNYDAYEIKEAATDIFNNIIPNMLGLYMNPLSDEDKKVLYDTIFKIKQRSFKRKIKKGEY